MTAKEIRSKGLIPFTSLIRNIFKISDNITIYNDKRKNGRRIKIMLPLSRATKEQFEELEKKSLKYNLVLTKHYPIIYNPMYPPKRYALHFENK